MMTIAERILTRPRPVGDYKPRCGIQQLMKRGKGLSVIGGVVEGAYEDKAEFVDTACAKLAHAMVERGIEG